MTRSELLAALSAAGVKDDKVGAIVGDMLAKGQVEDDLLVSDDALGRHLDAIEGVLQDDVRKGDTNLDDYEPELEPEPEPELELELDGDAVGAMLQVVDHVAKGAQNIVDDVGAKHTVLCKATMAMGKAVTAIVKRQGLLEKKIDAMQQSMAKSFEGLSKGLNVPIPPRAVDMQALPHPGDDNSSGVSKPNPDDVMNKAMSIILDDTSAAASKAEARHVVTHLEMGPVDDETLDRFAKACGL